MPKPETITKPLAEWDRLEVAKMAGLAQDLPKDIRRLRGMYGGVKRDIEKEEAELKKLKGEITQTIFLNDAHPYHKAKNQKEKESMLESAFAANEQLQRLEKTLEQRYNQKGKVWSDLEEIENEMKVAVAVLQAYAADVFRETDMRRMLVSGLQGGVRA
jgi:chromosome segregation ATPase